MSTKVKWLCLFTLVFASACGYQGYYRYSCQEAENWHKDECNPPICKVDGACSKDLIGFDPDEYPSTTIQQATEETVAP